MINKNYIYKNKDNKLVLHDFIYEMFYKFELSKNDNITDFALQLVNRIADRTYIWQLYTNEINSESLNFFIGLYNFIEKNGGVKNCCRLTEYTYNINNLNNISELVTSGIIVKEEVQIKNKELICNNTKQQDCSRRILMTVFSIIRDSKGHIVLPDEIYKVYSSFDGDNAYSFAKFAVNKILQKHMNITEDVYNYYAAIFELIEKEKLCTTVSDFCKDKTVSSNKEHIKLMIDKQKAKMYQIKLDTNGSVTETPTNNTDDIEKSAYSTANEAVHNDIREEEHKIYLENQIIGVEKELNTISNDINYANNYSKYKNTIDDLKIRTQNIYEYAKHKFELREIHDKNIIIKTEKKYNEFISKIENLNVKFNKMYSENNKQKNNKEKMTEHVDYYEQIKSEFVKFENELNTIVENMTVNSDKEYISLQSAISNLRERLHKFYDKALKEAHQNASLTGPLIKEATTKNNELNKKIESSLENLEVLKKRLLFKNIFNG